MQRDIDALRASLQDAQKGLDEQRARLDEQIAEAEKQIADVERALQDLNRAARMTDADFGIQLERLVRETQELRGMIELTEYRLGQVEKKTESALPEAGETDTPSSADVPDDPKEMLKYADALLKDRKTAEARGVLREVIRKAPKKPGITDAAYYKLGSIYYDDKKYRSALQELVKVVENFARGAFADDAYFKIGLSSMDLGNLEDAQIFFNEVIKSYRKSPLVGPSRKKLKEIQARLKKEKR